MSKEFLSGAQRQRSFAEMYFNDSARQYDEETENEGWLANEPLKRLLESLPSDAVNSYLDLGPGTGQTMQIVLDKMQPERIVAVENSAAMAAELIKKEGLSTGRHSFLVVPKDFRDYMKAYAESSEDRFDLITAIAVLEFVPDADKYLSLLSKLLNPGGRAAVTFRPRRSIYSRKKKNVWSTKYRRGFNIYSYLDSTVEDSITSEDLEIEYRESFSPYGKSPEAATYNFVVAKKPS